MTDIRTIARAAARDGYRAAMKLSGDIDTSAMVADAVAVAVLEHALALDEEDTKDRPPTNVILALLIDEFSPSQESI